MAALLRASKGRFSSLFSPQRAPCITPWTPPCACHGIRAASTSTVKTRRTRAVVENEAPPAKKTATGKTKKKTATVKKAQEQPPDARIPPLSLAQLRNVAVLCGRNASGTKAALRADLEEAVLCIPSKATEKKKETEKKKKPQRILSIDMGVRNLAYCLLEVEASRADGGGPTELVAWERLSLIDEDEARQADTDADADVPPKTPLFTPPRLAAVAARLVRDRLLALQPTHVVIERQRSRSGGGMAVLEWTLRVNALEAMLHGIFAYHQVLADTSQAMQDIEAVSPKRVSVFLLRGGIGNIASRLATATTAKKEKDIKDVKEAFLADVLRAAVEDRDREASSSSSSTSLLTYKDVVSPMVEAYLLRWDTKQRRSRSKTPTKTAAKTKAKDKAKDKAFDHEKDAVAASKRAASLPILSKIDDLADCIAQGLIWLEWERNKAILRERGAATLLDEKQLPG